MANLNSRAISLKAFACLSSGQIPLTKTSKIQLSSMKFEIISHLYNFAIAELIIGSSLISMPIALRRFRFGIWAIKEIKTILPSINFHAMQKNQNMTDLTLQNLSVLESVFLGLSYFSLFEIHEKNEITLGFNNIAAIIFAASKKLCLMLKKETLFWMRLWKTPTIFPPCRQLCN